MLKSLKPTLILLTVSLLIACTTAPETGFIEERILVWHGWSGAEAAALQALINDFTSLNPNARVIVANPWSAENDAPQPEGEGLATSQDLLLRRFTGYAQLGLGPDLLIGPSDWVRQLANAGLIQDLSGRGGDTSDYLSTAVETLRHQSPGRPEIGLYGLPLSLETEALYYNKTMVTTPAETLDILLLQAGEGQKIALNSSFGPAFWGVKAFGGRLFDEEGRVLLDRGGFANWLNWLKTAQTEANFILEDDHPTLEELFKQGEVAYMVGTIDILPVLQGALGEDAVGVAPLPRGPNQSAGPFLHTEAVMLNASSSTAQSDLAFRLAQFLADTAQQTELMRKTNKVPANNRVRVDPQIYPVTAAFLAQAKTATPFPNFPQMDTVLEFGDDAYLQILTGAASPTEAAQTFTNRVNKIHGFEPIEVQAVEAACSLSGELEVWHRWPDSPPGTVLQTLADEFTERCPAVTVKLIAFETEALRRRYRAAGGQTWGPDLVIAPSDWLPIWAAAGSISNLAGIIQPELLQQYNSTAITAMQLDQGLYGLPLWLDVMALYYRSDEVADPPRVLDDLLNQTDPVHKAVLPLDTAHAHWGMFAFGALTYDEDFSLQVVPDGIVAWMEWLLAAQDSPGIILSFDPVERKEIFKAGEASYYAGEASELTELQQAIGSSVLRVAPFPTGPAGEPRTQLRAEGVMVNPATLADPSGQHADLALEFGRFLTNQENQEQLMRQANLVPGHINVNAADYPAVAGFLEQAETAGVWWFAPSGADVAVQQEANRIFDAMVERVVIGREDVAEVVDEALAVLQKLREPAE